MNIQLKKRRDFDPAAFLAKAGLGRKIVHLGNKERAFSQGDPADSVFYIQSGRIRLSVIARFRVLFYNPYGTHADSVPHRIVYVRQRIC